jgi:hypothetical protein
MVSARMPRHAGLISVGIGINTKTAAPNQQATAGSKLHRNALREPSSGGAIDRTPGDSSCVATTPLSSNFGPMMRRVLGARQRVTTPRGASSAPPRRCSGQRSRTASAVRGCCPHYLSTATRHRAPSFSRLPASRLPNGRRAPIGPACFRRAQAFVHFVGSIFLPRICPICTRV